MNKEYKKILADSILQTIVESLDKLSKLRSAERTGLKGNLSNAVELLRHAGYELRFYKETLE